MVPGPKTIRGRVVLSTLCATTVVMLLLLAVAFYGVMQVVRQAISDNLVERLDLARSAVERGDLASAVDSSGPTIVQVVGADGRVIVASENARGCRGRRARGASPGICPGRTPEAQESWAP